MPKDFGTSRTLASRFAIYLPSLELSCPVRYSCAGTDIIYGLCQLKSSITNHRYTRKTPQSGSIWLGLLIFLGVTLGTITLLFFAIGKVVPPGYIGIRHNGYGVWGLLKKGYSEIGLQPGLHWRIPGNVSDIILLPACFQFINFSTKGGDLDLPELEVPTSDGSKVKVDVTLVLRYFAAPGTAISKSDTAANEDEGAGDECRQVPFHEYRDFTHGGPHELVTGYTADQTKQLRTISIIAQQHLTRALFSLSTSEFYNPTKREAAAVKAATEINEEVSKGGIELWGALIRRYFYSQQNIDDQIFAKIFQEQTELLNAEESALAAAKAETVKQEAFGDAEIRNLVVQGESDARVMKSEGDLYEATKSSEGDLLAAKSKAEVDAAKAAVLEQVAGSANYVAREMTPLLRTLKGGVITDVDPYDIERWVSRLVGKKE